MERALREVLGDGRGGELRVHLDEAQLAEMQGRHLEAEPLGPEAEVGAVQEGVQVPRHMALADPGEVRVEHRLARLGDVFEEGEHRLAAGLQHAVRFLQVDGGFLRQDVGEDREEDAEIRRRGLGGQADLVDLLEAEILPSRLAARVVQQLRHDVEAEVAQAGIAGELGGEPAGAAADVDDGGAVAQALAPQQGVFQHAVELEIPADGLRRRLVLGQALQQVLHQLLVAQQEAELAAHIEVSPSRLREEGAGPAMPLNRNNNGWVETGDAAPSYDANNPPVQRGMRERRSRLRRNPARRSLSGPERALQLLEYGRVVDGRRHGVASPSAMRRMRRRAGSCRSGSWAGAAPPARP